MAEIEKRYRFRCYQADGSTVDWTETVDIADVGPVGGQRVEAKEATTSARPWSVVIVDVAEDITARLSDADGRAQLLRRLCDLSVSTDGGSIYTVLATGRIDAVEMVNVAAFRFEVQDERMIERTATIFRAGNTTRLAPAGIASAWLDFQPPPAFRYIVTAVDAVNNTTTYDAVGFSRPALNTDGVALPDDALDLIEDDVLPNPGPYSGNFDLLRVNIDGTDREVALFNGSPYVDPVRRLREVDEADRTIRSFRVSGYQDPGGVDQVRSVYFYMPDRDPTSTLPLHIGGQVGIDPFQLVADIYDGAYQDATNPATVRYDATALSAYDPSTNPNGLIGRFPRMHFRELGPANMAKWLEENIYTPLGVVPFVNAAGEISPRLARMPAVDQVPDPDALHEWTAANTTLPEPGWLNQGRDQVTVVRVSYEYVRPAAVSDREQSRSLDGLTIGTTELLREHDNVGTAGRLEFALKVRGVHRFSQRRQFADRVAYEMFDRFGDGPIYATVAAMSDSESVEAGDWAVLDLDIYPALQNQSRTGKRLVQVLSKVIQPQGPVFEVIEGGPNSQPLATPTLSMAANSADPRNAVDVTISGLGTGEGYELHLAENTTEPAEGSDEWQYRVLRGTGNETVTVREVPSGLTLWARARATAPGRISSDWTTADSQATTALTAPSGLADSGVAGDTATMSWTLGETDYDLIIDIGGTFEARLQAGTTSYRLAGLTPSTGYTIGLKHVDDFGGESTRITDTFTTTGSEEAVADMGGIRVLVGA